MAENRSRFRLRYTQAQKDAILKAVLLDGLYVAEAIRRAARGELDVAAFTIGDYAYDIVKNGRDDFEGRNDEALEHGTREALKGAHRANLRALRALTDQADPAERARVAKAVAETQRAMASGSKPKPARGESTPQPETNGHGSQSQENDTLTKLLELAQKGAAKPSSARITEDEAPYTGDVAATTEDKGEDEGQSVGAGRFART